MDWNAIDAISSAIGAVGVIVTIVYLASQIRQNTQSIQGQTEQSLMTLEKEVYSMIAEYASVYRRGTSDMSDLDVDETVQFDYIVAAEMSLVYSAYVQHRRKLISDEVWMAYVNGAQVQLAQQGYHQAWERLINDYPRSFVAVIDEIRGPAAVTA
jgi:predicted small secreted protein